MTHRGVNLYQGPFVAERKGCWTEIINLYATFYEREAMTGRKLWEKSIPRLSLDSLNIPHFVPLWIQHLLGLKAVAVFIGDRGRGDILLTRHLPSKELNTTRGPLDHWAFKRICDSKPEDFGRLPIHFYSGKGVIPLLTFPPSLQGTT